MNIIILFESDKQDDGTYHLSDYRAEHIRSILKSQVNDRLSIGILNDAFGSATVQSVTDGKVILNNIQLSKLNKPDLNIDIIVALPRPQTLKKVLFTSAMMGVRNVFFIRTNRVEKSFFHSVVLEKENLEKHLIDGLQQGKNIQIPIVSIHDKFKPFMQDSLRLFYEKKKESPQKLLPELDAKQNITEAYDNQNKHLLVAIGPEGGWVPFETEMMESLGFKKFKLCNWTLRVEHALTASLAQIELLK